MPLKIIQNNKNRVNILSYFNKAWNIFVHLMVLVRATLQLDELNKEYVTSGSVIIDIQINFIWPSNYRIISINPLTN